ncbi:MAG TPA: Gfo/Idh/MocA family oxidoreductase [Actinomycetes bacterium]|nr:Gfo/Idh/MocA family oxidoreductase [Actinomycetes bacterium]
MIGVGLIGYGLGGAAFHAPLVQAEPRLRLHAVVTSRAGQVRRDLPGVAVVASPAELLEDPAVGLVVVAAPNAVHFELAAAALRAGRHVVVDKPFTLSVAEADELIELAGAADRRLSVFHNRRWDSDFLTVRRCLETGLLGDVSSFVSRYDRFRPVPKGSWKEQDVPGSGLLWDLGPHLIDQALQLFGMPQTVWADVGVQRPGVEAVDYVHLALGYGRLRAVLHAGMEVRDPGPRFEVHGDRGSFVTWGLDRQEVDATLTTEVAGLELRGRLAGVPAAHHAYYAAMAAAVDGQGPVPVTPAEARDTIAVIELALASARQGRVLPFDAPAG